MTDQQQLPNPPSQQPTISDSIKSEAAAVVKSTTDEIETPSNNAQPSIFHVLFLPGGSVQKDTDKEENKPNIIIDDYLYQRHVFRKKAASRAASASNNTGVGGPVRIKEEGTKNNDKPVDGEIALNSLASPLEIAMVTCCVCPKAPDNSSSSEEQSSPTTQRSRLHRPIRPSNAGEDGDEPLDTPRTISMKDPKQKLEHNKQIGTLQQGQVAHFLKLLQMYCPQSTNEGLMYRSLAVEILQRTADWENGHHRLLKRGDNDDDGNTSSSGTTADTNSSDANGKKEIGQVGYTFRKRFHSGWYTGKVTEIIPRNNSNITANCAKDRRCVYNDGDEEDLSLEELKHLAELEELDGYHREEDEEQVEEKKTAVVEDGNASNSSGTGGEDTKVEGAEATESSSASTNAVAKEVEAVKSKSPPPVNNADSSNSNEHTVLRTFLAVGGMKLLARWLVEAYTVVQPSTSSNLLNNKRKASSQMNEIAVVSPSPTGALLLPLLTLLKSIPFDKDVIVASSIHKYIKRYKKALDKLSKGIDEDSLNNVVHPLAGGRSVGKAMRGVEEVMTSWNKATAALKASQQSDGRSDNEQKLHDPYGMLRDQLQSRFDELAAFHNNRTNPPEWVPTHVLGVVMASPKAAPASPTMSKPTLNSGSLKSNVNTSNNEWGTNRPSAAQLARDRFLEGFRKQKESVSSAAPIAGLVSATNRTSPPQKIQRIASGNDDPSPSSKKIYWADKPMGRKGVSPQPLVTERVFTKEEEYVEEVDDAEMQEMFGDEDDHDDDLPMEEARVGNSLVDAAVKDEGVKDEQEDSDLDDMF